ncbi:cyclic-di-AMP receptor [Fastidiosipila sanguinis]|uniref:Transcriptional regulator n=1 Tax=Fastidiosipila sanguinis TaxID=236753 RepID=A0A2S0KPF9_9FIRM|nr:cyclic-di-AMP receptor [Fastidiosipila sanguinis]AVM42894.1 hypothetical protein C5Q98_06585 [Fastidiosipila sanguinis]
MKLIFTIVHDDDSSRVMGALNKEGYRITKLSSTGGFLRSGNTTLMCGVEDDQVKEALDIIRDHSSSRKVAVDASSLGATTMGYGAYPVEVNVGGATVFIVNVEYFEKM